MEPQFKAHPPRASRPLWLEHVVEDLLRSGSADFAKVHEVLELATVAAGEFDRAFDPQLLVERCRFHRNPFSQQAGESQATRAGQLRFN